MQRARQFGSPGLMIRRVPEDRRKRMSRLRTFALLTIGVIAVTGVVLQEAHDRNIPGQAQVAQISGPFEYFPG